MTRHTLQLLVLLCLLILGVGCQSKKTAQKPATCPTVEVDESTAQALAMLIFIEPSAEAGRQGEATPNHDDLIKMVQSLPPGTAIFAAVVAEHASPRNALLHDILPPAPEALDCVIQNPFDARERQACKKQENLYKAQQACLHSSRQQMIAHLGSLDSLHATHSTFWDVMMTAGEVFTPYAARIRWVIVINLDLATFRMTSPPAQLPGFAGVRVIVRGAIPGTTPQGQLAAFKQLLAREGADLSLTPLGVPWSTVMFHPTDSQPGILVPPLKVWPTDLEAFMAALVPGHFGVIVASLTSERAAQNEVRHIAARYAPLRPSYWRSDDGRWWAVRVGDAYDLSSATALKEKAIELGLRADSFVFVDSRR